MEYLSTPLITADQVCALRRQLQAEGLPWKDGRLTAGQQAASVKRNAQLDPACALNASITEFVIDRLRTNPLTKSYALIRRVHSLLISRFESGDGYGWHVDNPFSKHGRRDLSFTLFLSDKADYSGGELMIQASQDVSEVRLDAGDVILYPSSSLHCVAPVSAGVRFACVGWIESYVKSVEDRALLFHLDSGSKGLLARHGRSDELDLIFQAYTNAVRRLAD